MCCLFGPSFSRSVPFCGGRLISYKRRLQPRGLFTFGVSLKVLFLLDFSLQGRQELQKVAGAIPFQNMQLPT